MVKGPVRDPACELDDFVAAYEAAQTRNGSVDLAAFLPSASHPLYREVLRELVCVDLEYGWTHGRPRKLAEYLERFPQLSHEPEDLREIAFEEYRQRLQVGDCPAPEEYQLDFGVDVRAWARRIPADSDAPRPRNGKLPGPVVQREDGEATAIPTMRVPQDDGVACTPAAGPPQVAKPRAERPVPEDSGALPEVGTEFLGFQLIGELGRGSFGRVYLARQGELADRPVALKVSRDALGESHTLAQLQHTNIVPVYSVHHAPPFHAVCMPFLGSATLADLLRELRGQGSLPASGRALVGTLNACKSKTRHAESSQSAMPGSDNRVSEVDPGREVAAVAPPGSGAVCLKTLEGLSYVNAILWLGARLADGLTHAHERGILHRDLKPANVLLADDGQPLLLDFNLSEDTKLRAGASAAFIGGTLPYMAPEHLAAFQERGRSVDPRSDIYGLGVILYELLTGWHPFPTPEVSREALLGRMLEDRRRPPPTLRDRNSAVSPAVESIIRHCLEPEPERRYQTARQLQEDLDRHLNDLPLRHAREPSLRERARKWGRRHPRLASVTTAALVAVALLVGLGALFVLRGQRLAQLEASATLTHFHKEMREARTLFVEAPTADNAQLRAIAAACRRPLERYQILDNPAWQESASFKHLPPEGQDQLLADAAELLFLLAALTRLEADPEPNTSQRAELLKRAWQFSERAAANYQDADVPGALRLEQAVLAERLDRHADARCLRAKIATAPRSLRERCQLACAYVIQGRYRKALPLWQKASVEAPQNVWAWYGLGDCYDRLNRPAQAASCYTACIALDPAFHGWHFKRGLAHLRQNQYQLALADFDQAVRLRPRHAETHINRGLAQLGLGRAEDAVRDLTRAIDFGANEARYYLIRARAREKARDAVGAQRDREVARQKTPADEASWIARGVARAASAPRAALIDFDRALAFNPRSEEALESKASVLAEQLGKTEEAIRVLDRAVEFHPESAAVRAARAVLRARLGQRTAALEDAREALAVDSSPAILYQVAGAYALSSREHAEDGKEALALLTSALRQGYGHDLIATDTDLVPLREAPQFRTLLQAAQALRSDSSRISAKK